MDKLSIYNAARTVPAEALTPITAGRLKGMSDINPMYRIKRMTEIFGACGFGWWYEITRKEIIFDELTAQKACFVDVLLYVKDPDSGEVSHGIPGTGGSSFVATERNGKYMSDECFKMALTDALSVACKAFGIAADVYFNKDRTKYTAVEDIGTPADKPPEVYQLQQQQPATMTVLSVTDLICEECGNPITDFVSKAGKRISADWLANKNLETYGKRLCANCGSKRKNGG